MDVDMHSPVANLFDRYRPEVENELDCLLNNSRPAAAEASPDFSGLWKRSSETVIGGKLARPAIVLGVFDTLSHGEVGSSDRRATLRIAAAVELLHYAFLLHDDVLDQDLHRRGKPNLIGVVLNDSLTATDSEKASHWGQANGILIGDLYLSLIHRVFAREQLPGEMRETLLDLLDHAIGDSVVGEYLDIGFSDKVLSADLPGVLKMTRLKTATYSFAFPLKAGALLAGGDPRWVETLGEIGRRLGTAFQLQDDLFSMFGNPSLHGKDELSDLREGKETAIIAYARMTDAWPRIESHFGAGHIDRNTASKIRAILEASGAKGLVEALIADQLRSARDLIDVPRNCFPKRLVRYLDCLMSELETRRS